MDQSDVNIPFLRTLSQMPRPASTIAREMRVAALEDLERYVFPHLREVGTPIPQKGVQLLYQATVGVGKTDVMVHVAGHAILSGLRVAIRVPTTKLAKEVLLRIEQHYPGAAGLWLGREKEDPNHPNRLMCPRAKDVRIAQSVGGKPTDVCGSFKRIYCPFHPERAADPCGYLLQNLQHKAVVIFAGDKMLELSPRAGMKRSAIWKPYKLPTYADADLFGVEKRRPIKAQSVVKPGHDREFDLLLIDETNPLAFLEGFEKYNEGEFKPDLDIINALKIPQQNKHILESFVLDIADLLIQTGEDNYLTPYKPGGLFWDCQVDELLAIMGGNDADQHMNFASGIKASELTTVDFIDIVFDLRQIALESLPVAKERAQFPQMNAAQISNANAAIKVQRKFLLQLVKMCELMILGLRRGLPHLKHLKVGSEKQSLKIRRLKKIGHAFSVTPTMIFDATPRPDLLRHVFPNLQIAFNRTACDGQGVKRIQLTDSDLTYSTLKGETWPARIALLGQLAHRMHGSTGIILPKPLRERIDEEHFPHLLWEHFGNLRGLNEFENVRALLVVGRQAAHYSEAEEQAAVLTGAHIEGLAEKTKWYPKQKKPLYSRGIPGAGWLVSAAEHPDPIVEQVRASVTDDGLEQALGRGRNVRRASDHPLVEYVITNNPTDRLVDGVFDIDELKACTSWVGVFLELGVWIEGGTKGLGDLGHLFALVLRSQRLKSQYRHLFGKSAFEGPNSAADWFKTQKYDNPKIGLLASQIDRALGNNAPNLILLANPYPLHDFQPIRAKVRGARYFAQLHVRVAGEQTPREALLAILGPCAGEVEIED